jgi:long-chain acyl-CoA synthetase
MAVEKGLMGAVEDLGEMPILEYDTFPKLLLRNYKQWPCELAMCRKEFGIWSRYTWKDSFKTIKFLCLGLIRLGFGPGDGVAVIGDNDPEWYWVTLAAQSAHGWVVGIYADSLPSEIKYIVEHSGAQYMMARDQEQIDKVLQIKNELSELAKVIYWEPKGLEYYDDPLLVSFAEIVKSGEEYEKDHPGLFEEKILEGSKDNIAMLPYTSGTTGRPKGIPLTHLNLITCYTGLLQLLVPLGPKDSYSSIAPPAHISETIFGLGPHLLKGVIAHFPEGPETAENDTREVGAQLIGRVAKMWENLVSMILVKINDAGFLRKKIFDLALRVGYKVASLRLGGKRVSLLWRGIHSLAYWIVFRPLQDQMGLSRVRFPLGGGAYVSPDSFKLLHALGIRTLNAYGPTETAGLATAQSPEDIRNDTVGVPLPGTRIRISDEDEILIGGDHVFSGYHKDPVATEKTIRKGWFHTGDAGHISDDGHVIFYDRISELGELSTGAKYAPSYIESSLRFSTYIKDALTVGGKEREFISAIVNIDFESVGKWAENHRIPYTTFLDLSQKDEIAELVRKEIERVNRAIPVASSIKKYVLLHKEFDADESELTRTRKLRRGFMEEKYANIIGAIYLGEEAVPVEASVTYRDGRTGVTQTVIKIRSVEEARV